MSHPIDDIAMDMRHLLDKIVAYPKRVTATMLSLYEIMESDDRAEFVRLMQKWLASS